MVKLRFDDFFGAFRNPHGHKHEDHLLVQLEPCEASMQMIVISYLMEQIDMAVSE